MAIIRKPITITPQLHEWLQTILLQGDYTNESEYFRDLIRHDKEKRTHVVRLKQEIDSGFESGESGESGQSFDQIWDEVYAFKG